MPHYSLAHHVKSGGGNCIGLHQTQLRHHAQSRRSGQRRRSCYIHLSLFTAKNKIYSYQYVRGPTPQNPKFFKFGCFAHFGGLLHPISPFWDLGPLHNIPLPKTEQTYKSVSTSFFDAFFTVGTKSLTTQFKGQVWP
jgi:hypothetical protein